jgi:hypothetical protein
MYDLQPLDVNKLNPSPKNKKLLEDGSTFPGIKWAQIRPIAADQT